MTRSKNNHQIHHLGTVNGKLLGNTIFTIMIVIQCMIPCVSTGEPAYVTDKRGWSPVHEAAFAGHPDCLELLLKHGKLCLAVAFFLKEYNVRRFKWSLFSIF